MDRHLVLTRAAALDRLAAAVPRLGHAYAARRNTDVGPQAVATTSSLSPYLRRRLLLEQEVVGAAIDAHGPQAASKFIEEVFWRSYFKGYLESHPAAWTRYLQEVAEQRGRLAGNAGLRRGFDAAVGGLTGIDGFDDWAQELVRTGWLHNHARMWFASIWIFTLRLPWVLGAEFFLRHLVDGDPASNTLSWRWVAGLHTRGKAYAARAENIRRFTDGRFSPEGLNESPVPLDDGGLPGPVSLSPADVAPSGEVALLLHVDDLVPESLMPEGTKVVRIGGLVASAPDASDRVREADAEAMADAMARAGQAFGCIATPAVAGWSSDLPVVTAWAPVGPSADALPAGSLRLRRRWDDLTWTHATRGYYQVRSAIPGVLRNVEPC